jgi:manganese-dependent inorganic pyrophosphatase
MPTLVFGHKNPDTDAICAPIAYADFLRRTDRPDAEAACCGELNARTVFALQQAKLEPPRLIMDVRPTVAQIVRREIIFTHEGESLHAAFNRMRQHQLRSLPVLNAEGKLTGLVSITKLVGLLLPDYEKVDHARIVESNLSRICEVLKGHFIHRYETEKEQEYVLSVAAYSAEKFTEKIHQFPPERLLIVAGDRPTVIKPAIEYGVRAIILSGGYGISDELLALAKERNVNILSSPHDTASTTLLIKCAKRITLALDSSFISFNERTLIKPLRQSLQDSNQPIFPVTNDKGELIGVFSKSDLVNPPGCKLILVDHNEFTQAVSGADEADILEVIDHHRLGGGLTSREPIRFINEPLGSTSTIVARMFRQRNVELTPSIALCMASGIISDTLYLTSPTTTNVDRDILDWLSRYTPVPLKEFAEKFFATGSALQIHTADNVVGADCKQYEENGWKIAVAQVEELGFDHFWPKKEALSTALNELLRKRQLDFACLLITDITTHDSYLLCAGNPRIVDGIDYPETENNLFHLEGIVSRKKQLLPHLCSVLSKISR